MKNRGATTLCGILLVDKPGGMTSHDVVSRIRRLTGEGRVGHAGTLDPMATGLLVVLVGPATRLAPYLSASTKTYRARITFGTATETDDADGEVIATTTVPPVIAEFSEATRTVAALRGIRDQIPPAFSAIKSAGRVAHREARSGRSLPLSAREIEIYEACLESVDPGPPVQWTVELAVSKGTYIRAIARDLGSSLGTTAHLSALRRTASGSCRLDEAHTLEELESAQQGIAERFTDPVKALGLPVIEVDAATATKVSTGNSIPFDDLPGVAPPARLTDGPVTIVHSHSVLAVYNVERTMLKPEVVIGQDRPLGAAR